MKKNKFMLLPLIPLLLLSSCNNEKSYEKFEEYYDYNWKTGDNALNATQPTIKNPVGNFSELNEIRRSQNRVGLPSKGQANILVVPLTFKDDTDDMLFTDADLEDLSETYFSEFTIHGYPSVATYYKDSSFDTLSLSGVVSPVVCLPDTFINYILKIGNNSKESVYNEIVDYVYQYLFVETKTYYIGDFDSDNDMSIDAISFVANYPFTASFGSDTYDIIVQSFLGVDNVYFSDSINDVNKTPVNSFSFTSDQFRSEMFNGHDSHVFINLVGRMLGLDDYSDKVGNESTYYFRAPLGYMDMMDGMIGDHSPFSKYQLGWIEPTLISATDIDEDGLTIELNPSSKSKDALILYTGSHNKFGEYLIIDYYTPTKLNQKDSTQSYLYGNTLFSQSGIRVYKVDARLVKGYGDNFYLYEGNVDFNEQLTLVDGTKVNYVYDYAFTNNSVNDYYQYGITSDNPLVSLLSKTGINRHLMDFSYSLTNDDLFLEGDGFGLIDQIEGFYKNFRFNGNGKQGPLLNIIFEVVELKDTAKITLRRVK